METLKMYFLLKMGIFHRYVSLLEGTAWAKFQKCCTCRGISFPRPQEPLKRLLPLLQHRWWPLCRKGFRSKIPTTHDTVDGRNLAPVEVGRLCHYLQGFKHPRWCRISSINSINENFSRKFRGLKYFQGLKKFRIKINESCSGYHFQ